MVNKKQISHRDDYLSLHYKFAGMFKVVKLVVAAVLLLVLKASAQMSVLDTKKLDKLKGGHTYILVKQTNFPDAARFLAQMQKSWVLSKSLQYLPYDSLRTKSAADDSFLSLETLNTTTVINTSNMTSFYYFLSFWTLKESFFKKEQVLKRTDKEPVADIYLSIDPGAVNSDDAFKTMDFDGGGILYNWSPGMAGNYLQQLGLLVNAGKRPLILTPISNTAALDRLANDTLLVPDFNMINYSAFSGKAKIQDEVDVKTVFEKYPFPYRVITKDALDKKIITAADPFYYLLFLKIGSAKVICVINGKTGETVYSRATPFSSNLKATDINALYKQVKRD